MVLGTTTPVSMPDRFDGSDVREREVGAMERMGRVEQVPCKYEYGAFCGAGFVLHYTVPLDGGRHNDDGRKSVDGWADRADG